MTRSVSFAIGAMFLANAWLFVDAWRAWKSHDYPDAFECLMCGVACYSAIFFFPAYGYRVMLFALVLIGITKGLKRMI
ncbi:hypothetical protein GJ904_20035 [Salmonella enterica]|nr:hypothetical protein [Salmonella enterica subsp. enterica serovar Saintpaul]EEC1303355.1 hypothetical protein [Salmonella enterica]